MQFQSLPLSDARLVTLEPREDDRGAFARMFCAREFAEAGLAPQVAQANLSTNARAGTVRGLHFQRPPHAETKLIFCIRGAVYDVIVDIREDSPTFGQSFGAELTQDNCQAMYVPAGFAHGYQALTDGAAVVYLVSEFYAPDHEGGINHADPALGIDWPAPITVVSDRDRRLPLLKDR